MKKSHTIAETYFCFEQSIAGTGYCYKHASACWKQDLENDSLQKITVFSDRK